MFVAPEKQMKVKLYIYKYLNIKIGVLGLRCLCKLADISYVSRRDW